MDKRDFQSLPASHLPDDLKGSGGIMYVPSNPPSVWISDNVNPDDKPFWAGHEWECMANPDINTCLAVTKKELKIVEDEKGKKFYAEYIARRAQMLNGALRLSLKDEKLNNGNEQDVGMINTVRTVLKIGGSLDYLQTLFGERAAEIIGNDLFQNLERQDEILKRFGHLVITK